MFFERHESEMFEPTHGFMTESLPSFDDLCGGGSGVVPNPLKDVDQWKEVDHWQKVHSLLPTPPCSPEDLCYQAFPELIPAPSVPSFHQGLQVVPDDIPEDLVETDVEPLPVLELSDEEMQKLTSPTIYDDTLWQLQQQQQQQQHPRALVAATAAPCTTQQQPTSQMRENIYTGEVNNTIHIADMNRISHGIRRVQISDSVLASPGYSQSFVLTVNANPIQPLDTLAHLTTREILMSQQNATTWSLNADPNLLNERAAVGNYEVPTTVMVAESPTKKCRKMQQRRPSRSGSSGPESGSNDETPDDSEDGEITRATHNVLERKRREELKEKFQRLRDCLPELHDNDRAPKVLILKKSCEYVKYLEQEEQRLLADKELERQRFLILLNKQRNLLRQGILSMQ